MLSSSLTKKKKQEAFSCSQAKDFKENELASLLVDVRKEIDERMKRRTDSRTRFITISELQKVWSKDRIRKLLRLVDPTLYEDDINYVENYLIKTLSTLAFTRWDDWSAFRRLFLDRPDESRRDIHLPYPIGVLEADNFFGRPYGLEFEEAQYIFVPITVKEGSNMCFDEKFRLPFVNLPGEVVGQGAHGTVTKVVIARGYFLSKREFPSSDSFPAALKTFETNLNARIEVGNLKALRDSLSDHKHILPYLATIQVRENLFILSELADTNLERFLRSDSPRVQTASLFTNLIQQMTSIAGALRFLHEGIQLPGRLITCYHMDLKPDNILVFDQKNDHFGVGTWKISDFGISTFKECRSSTTISEADITVRDLLHRVKKSSGVPAKRPGGPFQAPEVHTSGERHTGTKSDVWSFGCIFVEVLAFACGGRDLVDILEEKRGKALDGESSFPNDYFYRDEGLNPHVQMWLNDLPKHSELDRRSLTNCQKLVLETLEIDPQARPSAGEVYDRLGKIDMEPEAPQTAGHIKSVKVSDDELLKIRFFRSSQYEDHKERNPPRVEGTCLWFLQHSRYLHWRDSPTSCLLWVSADPGCGKSVLAKSLVDGELKTSETRTTCYFFFKDDNDEQKTATSAICALLHQLFSQRPQLLAYADEDGDMEKNGDHLKINFSLLWKMLLAASMAPNAGEIVYILDALDECNSSQRRALLERLCSSYGESSKEGHINRNLKFLITSRAYQDIEMGFNRLIRNIPTIHLSGEEETSRISYEIDLVLNAELNALKERVSLSERTLSSLRTDLSKVEHRTYLWLKLVLYLINEEPEYATESRKTEILCEIPSTVEDAYTAILEKSKDKKRALRLLSIICIATRPLTVNEMFVAVKIQESHKTRDDVGTESPEYARRYIRNLCGLFVSVIDEKVYLLHQTAKEFLLSPKTTCDQVPTSTWRYSIMSKNANLLLATVCIWYLLLADFDEAKNYKTITVRRDGTADTHRVEKLASQHEFLAYSAQNWYLHFRAAGIEERSFEVDLAIKLCDTSSQRFFTWFFICSLNDRLTSNYRTPMHIEGGNMFHLVAILGLPALASRLLRSTALEINAIDDYGWTPLHWAVDREDEGMVAELLSAPGIEINKRDRSGKTPLWAALNNERIVRQLLAAKGIDVNQPDSTGKTPLLRAVELRVASVVAQLLAMPGIEVNQSGEEGRTPLWKAVESEDENIVPKLLIMPDIDVNRQDCQGVTPLWLAVSLGNEDVVNQLLAIPNIDVDKEDNRRRSPLWLALCLGNKGIANQLLSMM